MSHESADADEMLTALLALRAQSGDLSRFDELYERVAPALYGWAALRIRPDYHARLDPEEIVQETWFRALRRFEDFHSEQAIFRSWIFGIAKNVLLEGLRDLRAGEMPGAGTTTRILSLERQPDQVTSITRRVARADALQRFLERVRALGEEEQTLTILCGLEGLSCEQAAQRLGLTYEAAAKRWQRLRAEIVSRDLPRELLSDGAVA
jgi:RNA polymerase sigma factor (sigma-70 family)